MKIIYKISDDYSNEDITVISDDDRVLANFNTQSDCPEDNSLTRIGVMEGVQAIVKELTGKDIQVENQRY